MQLKRINNKQKGSVLIAVVGVLAVVMVMAITFSIKMQTAIDKASSKALVSDVHSVANSGFMYVVYRLLGNADPITSQNHQHSALEVECEMANVASGSESLATPDRVGSGYSSLIKQFNSTSFSERNGAKGSYMPAADLNPATVQYMIEDLSAKLPLGHVSQYFQRYLISVILYNYMGYNVIDLRGEEAELFESSATGDTKFDHYQGSKQPLYIRSLLPWRIAKSGGLDKNKLKYKGLPLADGVESVEELGSTHTHFSAKNNSSSSEKVVANDEAIGGSRYAYLAAALTTYARFVADGAGYNPNGANGTGGSGYRTPVSYASINPRVMYHQDERLYNSLFAYDTGNLIFKMMHSVSIPPATKPSGAAIASDIETAGSLEYAIADVSFISANIGDNLLIQSMTGNSTSSVNFLPITYNSRNKKDPANELQTCFNNLFPGTTVSSPPINEIKTWSSFYFSNNYSLANAKNNAYYDAMKTALARLKSAMKEANSGVAHDGPAENLLSTVITRKALEYMIIKSVFGNSIMFSFVDNSSTQYYKHVSGSKLFILDVDDKSESFSTVNHELLVKALEHDRIDLNKVFFVKNALEGNGVHASYAEYCFVPEWANDNGGSGGSLVGSSINSSGSSKATPQVGFGQDGAGNSGAFVNYLAHPETDQRGLRNSYVSVPAMASYLSSQDGVILDYAGNPGPDPKFSDGGNANVHTLHFADNSAHPLMKSGTSSDLAYVDLSTAYAGGIPPIVVGDAPAGNAWSKVLRIKAPDDASATVEFDFIPADFGPFESKVRMAVLVNLLNSIIPPKVSLTRNSADANDSLFNGGSTADTLKDFIGFASGEYKINSSYSTYMNGWVGGIQTPGMTFWKYGVHSTTFKVTVDANKYDESIRKISVVTFDTDRESGENSKNFVYDVNNSNASVYSSMYLHPLGRSDSSKDRVVMGTGKKRYPYFAMSAFNGYQATDGFRVISSIWTDIHSTDTNNNGDYFWPIHCFPETVVNNLGSVSSDGSLSKGEWYYTDGGTFPTFRKSSSGWSSVRGSTGWTRRTDCYSTGSKKDRYHAAGVGSWFKFKRSVSANRGAGTLELGVDIAYYKNPYQPESATTLNVSILSADGTTVIWNKDFVYKGKTWSYNFTPQTITVDLLKTDYLILCKFVSNKGALSGVTKKTNVHIKEIYIREK